MGTASLRGPLSYRMTQMSRLALGWPVGQRCVPCLDMLMEISDALVHKGRELPLLARWTRRKSARTPRRRAALLTSGPAGYRRQSIKVLSL